MNENVGWKEEALLNETRHQRESPASYRIYVCFINHNVHKAKHILHFLSMNKWNVYERMKCIYIHFATNNKKHCNFSVVQLWW